MTDRAEAASTGVGATGVDVRPLSGHTGAEILGLDLARPLDAAEREIIARALDRWKVVFFRESEPFRSIPVFG